MANWASSSLTDAVPGQTDLMSVTLRRDYRLAVPAEVRRAVAWLKEAPKRDVVFELNEPGRVRVLDAEVALPRILEAMQADPADSDDLRLIYSRGKFIRDRLDLSDPVVPHLGILADVQQEAGTGVFVRAHGGQVDIWSDAYRSAEIARARTRQESVMAALRGEELTGH